MQEKDELTTTYINTPGKTRPNKSTWCPQTKTEKYDVKLQL